MNLKLGAPLSRVRYSNFKRIWLMGCDVGVICEWNAIKLKQFHLGEQQEQNQQQIQLDSK